MLPQHQVDLFKLADVLLRVLRADPVTDRTASFAGKERLVTGLKFDDKQDEADIVETHSAEIWHFHDRPVDIDDNDYGTIRVEALEVEPGVTTVPAGAEPIARMAASMSGDDRLVDSRIDVNYGATPAAAHVHGTRWPCGEMYLRFAPEEGASTYTVNARSFGGQGNHNNTNQDFRYRGPNHSVFIDPEARIIVPSREDGYAEDWDGVCTWMVDGQYALEPHAVHPICDRDKDEYPVHLFIIVEHGFSNDPLTPEHRSGGGRNRAQPPPLYSAFATRSWRARR